MTKQKKQNKHGNNRVWIIPVVLLVILIIGSGSYIGYNAYTDHQAQLESSRIAESEQAELAQMRQALDLDTFFEGIWIDDVNLSGMTYEDAKAVLAARDAEWREKFAITLVLDDQQHLLTEDQAGIESDWQAVLDQAWQFGRPSKSGSDETADELRERFATVQALKQEPFKLNVSRSFNETALRQSIISFADSLLIEPLDAGVTGFELEARSFVYTTEVAGRRVLGSVCADEVLRRLSAGEAAFTQTMTTEPVMPAVTVASLKSQLSLVSEATTYLNGSTADRNINIGLVCKSISGMVLMPGEQFSFNKTVGKRTEERGYKQAGGIVGGILIQTFGGGICQPSTTLCQAVLKADLQIDERWAHSWPSSYTEVGLDATINWGSADLKFTNNTDYPIAIVGWNNNKKVDFQVYGRKLEEGVKIDLLSVITEVTPVTSPPEERFNPELSPGARNELRKEYVGRKATAYKIWKRNGVEFKREVAFHSTYRPLNAVFEYGPSPTPTTPETTPETTPSETTSTPSETTEAVPTDVETTETTAG
ncbi:MAG TPA: hypothetical protein DCM45_00940 [Clostridiales bacterium]|nr:hypothetical protein [Clostridiales bacterium]